MSTDYLTVADVLGMAGAWRARLKQVVRVEREGGEADFLLSQPFYQERTRLRRVRDAAVRAGRSVAASVIGHCRGQAA